MWLLRGRNRPEQRFHPSDREEQGYRRVIELARWPYHQRFAELDKAELVSPQVRYRQLSIGKRKHRCAVIRIKSPAATHPLRRVEDLWINPDTWRVVRSELTERAGSPTFKTTIITWTSIESSEPQ
ncbi:MAG: hypothetical protein ACP5U2_16000 [Bryobacteraceae bacterium]